jgi:hypothetical protein
VWYVYTGDDQNITVSTCSAGTLTDSRVNVYRTTAACTGFVAVAGNDDQGTPGLCGPNGFQGEVSFDALSGFLYYVVVDGYFGAQGTFTVTTTCNGPTCTPLPGNDDCVNPQSLTAGAFGTCTFTTGTTQCAAPHLGQPVLREHLRHVQRCVLQLCRWCIFCERAGEQRDRNRQRLGTFMMPAADHSSPAATPREAM